MAFTSDLEIVATEDISVERSVELEVCLKISQGQTREVKKDPERAVSDEVCLISPSSEFQLPACETPKRQCDVDEDFQLQAKKLRRGISETPEVEFSRGRDADQTQRKKTKRKGSYYRRRRKKPSKTRKLSSLPEKPIFNAEADACGGPVLEEDERRKNPVLFLSDDEDDSEKVEATPNADLTSEFPERRMEEPLNINSNSIVSGKFAYPSRNDPEAVEVLVSDLEHLQDLVFVNDTVIDFYIKYLQSTEGWCPDLKNRLHFYNSFFYKKLHEAVQSQKNDKNNRKMQKLRKWTKGINVFEKSYLFVPIHDKLHWSLAIICLPGASSEALSPDSCCILHFDSMNNGHKSQNIFRMLRRMFLASYHGSFCTWLILVLNHNILIDERTFVKA
ncbi:hypothetical protein O6H91_01G042700 [Diphasiastrum complanatum]|uniref:Uncharacterized protein n=1 Tax=Diphasiastrum complanatum TaxID=34168 RepID=A0ACC2EQ49_DIPCM|nr:hypothetical protein O6H91_01G042700 [Diphasiastrum complanatum]